MEAGDTRYSRNKAAGEDTADESPMPGRTSYPVDDVYYIVLSDESMMERIDRLQRDLYEEHYSVVNRIFQFDLSGTDDQEKLFITRCLPISAKPEGRRRRRRKLCGYEPVRLSDDDGVFPGRTV